MHADALGRLEIEVRLDGLGWMHVDDLHEPAGGGGADAQQREVDRTERAPDVVEEGRIGSGAGEEEARGSELQQESAPERAIAVKRPSGGEVVRGSQRDRERR